MSQSKEEKIIKNIKKRCERYGFRYDIMSIYLLDDRSTRKTWASRALSTRPTKIIVKKNPGFSMPSELMQEDPHQ